MKRALVVLAIVIVGAVAALGGTFSDGDNVGRSVDIVATFSDGD